MSGSEQPTASETLPKQTPQEYYQRQSAEASQANQKLEVMDKIRTSNMIFRGQKQLQQLVELKNRLLFGKEAVEAVSLPDDTIQFDCKTEHHYHGEQKQSAIKWPSLLKIGAGVLLAGTGVGAAVALPTIAGGIVNMIKPAATQPAESKPDAPTVTIGGQEYSLELGEPDPE